MGKFKDVPDTHWAYKAIEELSEKGIINGYEGDIFKPNGNVTRAEFCVMLARMDSRYNKDRKYLISMSDVPADAWYANEVNFCIKSGLVKGYPGETFRPNAFLTRAEVAVILVRFMEAER